jgi:TatD DNase family protein
MINYFDSHTHLQFICFEDNREEIIKKTLKRGVGFINSGTNKITSEKAVLIANKHPFEPVYATVGLHPVHTYKTNYLDENESLENEKVEKFDYDFYKKLAQEKKVVGIGECGLDYFHIESENEDNIKENQKKIFKKQLELAKEINKPLVIHCRPSKYSVDAYKDIYEILKDEEYNKIIFHFFAGNKEIAEKFIDLGYYFTFGGVVTLTSQYDKIVKVIPNDKILLETDAPYITPLKFKGEINQPINIIETYNKISELIEVPLPDLEKQVIKNNEKIFNIKIN